MFIKSICYVDITSDCMYAFLFSRAIRETIVYINFKLK